MEFIIELLGKTVLFCLSIRINITNVVYTFKKHAMQVIERDLIILGPTSCSEMNIFY